MMLEKFLPTVLVELGRLISDDSVPAAVRMRAYADLLDRVGLGATQKTEATVHTDGPSDVDAAISGLLDSMDRAPGPMDPALD